MNWNYIGDIEPPVKKDLWGWDHHYDNVHLCRWDGIRKTDDGLPFLISNEERGDDYSILLWVLVARPFPSKKLCAKTAARRHGED